MDHLNLLYELLSTKHRRHMMPVLWLMVLYSVDITCSGRKWTTCGGCRQRRNDQVFYYSLYPRYCLFEANLWRTGFPLKLLCFTWTLLGAHLTWNMCSWLASLLSLIFRKLSSIFGGHFLWNYVHPCSLRRCYSLSTVNDAIDDSVNEDYQVLHTLYFLIFL